MDPIRPTDPDARAMARRLLGDARHAALAVVWEGAPYASRVAIGTAHGAPLILVSELSAHTAALRADPSASLLVGEPGPRGDPLTHPRLSLQGAMRPADKASLRAGWLAQHPKSALYLDFADFAFWRMEVAGAHLVGGFGRAYRLTAADLGAAEWPGP